MKMKRAFNNNVVLAINDKGHEVIVMGKGIGFNKKNNDVINQDLIDKVYSLDTPHQEHPILNILNQIPPEIIYLTTKIISMGETDLGQKFNDAFLITLSDHLNFAIERANKQMSLINPLHWEVKNLYKKEYEVGKKAIKIIMDHMGQQLPDDEATSIALHFVNAQSEKMEMSETVKVAEITNKILDIISYHFQFTLDDDSLNYSRFITHLRYFILRHLDNKLNNSNSATSIFKIVTQQYPDIFQCVLKIQKYLHLEYGWTISNDEMTYLILHIQRMTARIIEN